MTYGNEPRRKRSGSSSRRDEAEEADSWLAGLRPSAGRDGEPDPFDPPSQRSARSAPDIDTSARFDVPSGYEPADAPGRSGRRGRKAREQRDEPATSAFDPTSSGGVIGFDPPTSSAFDPIPSSGARGFDPTTSGGVRAFDPTTSGGVRGFDPTTSGSVRGFDPTASGGVPGFDPTASSGIRGFDAGSRESPSRGLGRRRSRDEAGPAMPGSPAERGFPSFPGPPSDAYDAPSNGAYSAPSTGGYGDSPSGVFSAPPDSGPRSGIFSAPPDSRARSGIFSAPPDSGPRSGAFNAPADSGPRSGIFSAPPDSPPPTRTGRRRSRDDAPSYDHGPELTPIIKPLSTYSAQPPSDPPPLTPIFPSTSDRSTPSGSDRPISPMGDRPISPPVDRARRLADDIVDAPRARRPYGGLDETAPPRRPRPRPDDATGSISPGRSAVIHPAGFVSGPGGPAGPAIDPTGFGPNGFGKTGVEQPAYDQSGFDPTGFDPTGFDQGGFEKTGFDQGGFDKTAFDQARFGRPGLDRPGHQRPGADQPSYQRPGVDQPSYQRPGSDQPSYERSGADQPGFEPNGFDQGPPPRAARGPAIDDAPPRGRRDDRDEDAYGRTPYERDSGEFTTGGTRRALQPPDTRPSGPRGRPGRRGSRGGAPTVDPVRVGSQHRPHRWIAALSVIGILVLVAACGLGTYFMVNDERKGPSGARTSASQGPQQRDVSSRAVDPAALTEAEVFPKNTVPSAPNEPPYSLLKTQAQEDCTVAAADELGKLLVTAGCNQVVRATMKSPNGDYLITAGLFNLSDQTAAENAFNGVKPIIDAAKGRFLGMSVGPNTGTDAIVRAPTQLGWNFRGHFIAYCVIARTDGQPFAANDNTPNQITFDVVETYLEGTVIGARATVQASGAPSASPKASG